MRAVLDEARTQEHQNQLRETEERRPAWREQAAMENPMKAERERRESILRAEGQKQSGILVPEGWKQFAIVLCSV